MKLPRWLVIAMLCSSVLAVLAVTGWWWVTWPERTASTFAEVLSGGSSNLSQQEFGLDKDDFETLSEYFPRPGCTQFAPELAPRNLEDVVFSSQSFKIVVLDQEPIGRAEFSGINFRVFRGKVQLVTLIVRSSL